jgi:hypothetical protein
MEFGLAHYTKFHLVCGLRHLFSARRKARQGVQVHGPIPLKKAQGSGRIFQNAALKNLHPFPLAPFYFCRFVLLTIRANQKQEF